MCQGADLRVHFTYSEPPPLETRFPLVQEAPYWRELHRCEQCGHYLEYFDRDQRALYSEEYVSALYSDPEGIRRNFDRINALPPNASDNAGRVMFVQDFCRRYWQARAPVAQERRLLDVGAGLGVFPFRMKAAGWRCTTLEMDERLAEHHRSIVGVEACVADVRTVADVGTFDLITFNKVLEHVEDPIGMLTSVRRLIAPGGLVYVELPDGEAAEVEGKEREEYLLGHIHVFSFASYSLLISRSGLQLVHCERLHEPSSKFTLRGFARAAMTSP